jgi:hypothetical protein
MPCSPPAKVHRLTLATRNVSDIADLDVDIFNPFEPRAAQREQNLRDVARSARVRCDAPKITLSSAFFGWRP